MRPIAVIISVVISIIATVATTILFDSWMLGLLIALTAIIIVDVVIAHTQPLPSEYNKDQ